MIEKIKAYCDSLLQEFGQIPESRKSTLEKLADYITAKGEKSEPTMLVYICTHNSRRSHFGQIWSKVASEYYGIENVQTFSGGTEVTSFNGNAIEAIKRVGFLIEANNAAKNPHYLVQYDDNTQPIEAFSKVYDDPANPKSKFAAIMTCGEAEQNCPFVAGAEVRISTTYDDPKIFDDSPQRDQKYDERCRQIARETFYAFSRVKQ